MPDQPTEAVSLFARSESDSVELRGQCPRWIIAALDAACAVRTEEDGAEHHRIQIVNEVLGKWAKQQHRASTVFLRVMGSNPSGLESAGEQP